MKPDELLFAETHEWVHVAQEGGEKMATIGISEFALAQLTDLVYLELPEIGRTVAAGDEFGVVESVKAVSPLYSPVNGEVVAVNAALPDHLEILSESPYERGWIAKVRLTDEACLSKLLDVVTYQKQCACAGENG
ncbi:MAG: glycine cleavage system protein GcvH [Pirellulaceae bacterium]|nr:glycine cleavage system protein GcvH [Pirellulaceae bacterium]